MALNEVDMARALMGLPADRFADVGGGVGLGARIVCRCEACKCLFVSRSHDLADLDHICRGLCEAHAPARPCTCHPDDNPPVPCAQKYALTECRATTQNQDIPASAYPE